MDLSDIDVRFGISVWDRYLFQEVSHDNIIVIVELVTICDISWAEQVTSTTGCITIQDHKYIEKLKNNTNKLG